MGNPYDPGDAKAGEAVTHAELKVIELIARGHSSQEVADRLAVSKRTVDFHLANLYRKIQCHNRVQAINIMKARGELV